MTFGPKVPKLNSRTLFPQTVHFIDHDIHFVLTTYVYRHKIMGFYCSCITDLRIASKVDTAIVLAILYQSDIDSKGLSFCLKSVMEDLRKLVLEGIYDDKLKRNITVRVVASLGMELVLIKSEYAKRYYRDSPVSAVSISAVPGLVQFTNSTK